MEDTAAALELSLFGKVTSSEDYQPEEEYTAALHTDTDDNVITSKKRGAITATPAWVDEDEDTIQVPLDQVKRLRKLRTTEDESTIEGSEFQKRLKTEFKKRVGGNVEWAEIKHDDKSNDAYDSDNSSENSFLTTNVKVLNTDDGAGYLPSGSLKVHRMKDANVQSPAASVIQAVNFHSSGELLLAGGYDKTLKLFQVDGKSNPLIQSVFIPDMPIQSAAFCNSSVIIAGPRPFYYTYDLESGVMDKIPRFLGGRKEKKLDKFVVSPDGKWIVFLCKNGYLALVSASSNAWVANLKVNGLVSSAVFSSDSQYLRCVGSDGDIYKFDIRKRQCVYRHADEGSLGSTIVATNPQSDNIYATGSKSGVVNVYNDDKAANDAPIKSLMHLTTKVDHLKFNHDGQILAMSSRTLKDSLKMVHLPSYTVFSNWPTAKTPLHFVSALDFSPNSGYLAVGNDRGRVLLYRLNHYTST